MCYGEGGGTDLNGLNVSAGVIQAAGECEVGAVGFECALVVCGTHGGRGTCAHVEDWRLTM